MSSFDGHGVNKQDPLPKTMPDRAQELASAMGKLSHGHSAAEVINAGANVLLNALRQVHPTRVQAEVAFDELFGKLKSLLLERHYDPVTGKRRNVFPFTQHIEATHFDARKKN